jgi:hypothetical protein
MSKSQDLILDFVRRNYERQEERGRQVIQSLPFFATSLGALLAGIGVIGGHVETLQGSQALTAKILLGVVLVLALVTIFCIGRALLGPYDTREIVGPRDLIMRAQKIDAQYRACGEPVDEVDARVLAELQAELTEQMASAVEFNRTINLRRLAWQKAAFAALIASLLVGFATLFGVFVLHQTGADHERSDVRLEPGATAGTERGPEHAPPHRATAVARTEANRTKLLPRAAH